MSEVPTTYTLERLYQKIACNIANGIRNGDGSGSAFTPSAATAAVQCRLSVLSVGSRETIPSDRHSETPLCLFASRSAAAAPDR